jgi:hypothetical protein
VTEIRPVSRIVSMVFLFEEAAQEDGFYTDGHGIPKVLGCVAGCGCGCVGQIKTPQKNEEGICTR